MNAVVIVAGGKGLRMGTDVPKQFLPIGGKPVLMRTIERFYEYDRDMHVVLVLPETQQDYWHELCAKYHFTVPHNVVNGGCTRFHSVRNGLACVPKQTVLVGVHDGVRPFVSVATIKACYDEAVRSGAAVPVTPVVETLRHVGVNGASETVARKDYKLVQTPQVFDAKLLLEAYKQDYVDFFTDDASVIERYGHSVTLVEGNRENIKITTPFDIAVAEALVCQKG